ncbi:protein Shroom2 isoform X6 [Etheostoma spectabile]|uniref:protein Shroom2 isoform X6 n=1 Tax=Etheostoma spectabile TaxID=54343 RepID=UPI0013AF2E80|nr:protein Shroom2 isoform X6 [Etheostoma spectabile]
MCLYFSSCLKCLWNAVPDQHTDVWNMKMVDIVAQKMPSENDVHVARSFLTKILRSSMRKNRFKGRNEPISRPHSWHSTKFNDSQSETAKTQSPPTQVWHTRYDASSSSTDLSSGWEQTNLRRVSDQFSSLGSMDSLEHVSHPYPAGQLSPAKSNNSMEHLGGGKRDSAYSSFSTSSGTPDYTLSKSNAASTENVLYKVGQWDAPGKHNNGRNSQSLIEGVKLDDRVAYFQMPGVSCAGQQTEDSAGSRHSTSSRTSLGPVWHVPEKKKTASPSPPPPPPPARSDSFAATKVHERGLVIAHPEGPESYVPCKTSTENRRSHNPSLKNDSDGFHTSSDKSNHNQFSSNKQYSLSSSDVHQCQPYHQRNHSDKSTSSQPWAMPVPKPQNVAGYYSSMQELPTNGSSQHFGQNQRRNLSTSLTPTAADQNTDSSGQSRYYCVTPCQTAQHSPSGKSEDRKSITDLAQAGNERNSLCPQTVTQVKYHMPQQQQHSSHCKDSNGYSKHQVTTVLEPSVPKSSSDDVGSHRGPNAQNAEAQFMNYPPSRPSEQRRSLPPQLRELPQDIRHHGQVSNKICPQATPMLHSLSMDAAGQEEKTRGLDSEESLESKQLRRSDRFATTLRNEIQIRRAKLQKSMSAATLTEGETEEDRDVWKSSESITPTSAGGSFTNSYKDNLKEAQARVLRATSFRRKDLEPVLLEHPAAEASPNYPSSVLARKDVTPLPTVSESVMSKSGPGSGQVTRIGGRKRFPTEKKVRSFSEPDKINQVGVKEDLPRHESSALDQQKLLKESGKPAFPNHIAPPCYTETRALSLSSTSETEVTMKGIRSREYTEEVQGGPYSAHKQFVLDQQRLGTFAEYEARWNIQKPPSETRASGRYRSADNILDPGPEERTKTPCFHERSRSSPSADIYGQKIQVPARKSETEYSQTEIKPAELLNTATAFSDRGPGDCKVREKPVEFEHFSAPPTPPMHPGTNSDCRHRVAPANVNDRPTSISHSLPESGLPQPEERSHTELPLSGQRRKPSALEKPPPPKCPEVDSHESFAGSQSEIFTHCSPTTDPNSVFVPTHSAKGDSEQGKGLVDKGQGAVHHLSASNPQPASSPPASSFRPLGLATMEGQRAPSPQFSPQRLSDKPPVSLQDEDSNSMEHVIENQPSAVKKVPIRIVHSEEVTEKEKCPYLQHIDPPAVEAEGPGVTLLGSLGAAGQDSVFCAFTRQREPDSTPAAQIDPEPQRDAYITTVGAHIHSKSQQPTDESCSNGATVTRGLLEEQKREELARDIMGKDKSLADILDQSKMKTTMDLMEGIFPQGEQLLEGAHQRRKMPPKQPASRAAEDREKEDSMAAAVTMVTSSTYYSTSAPKAELLIKMKDMQEQEEEDSEDELDIDLANKKQELIDSLSKKLQVLREARESLQEDVLDNNALGDEVEVRVQQVCKPNELDKFRMFVGDLDKVVSLLLSLSGRLARVENALNSLEEDATAEERRTLMEKRKLLIRQHEDAKELKENLDRRERLVYDILAHHLPEDSLTDYEHFVKMKSALIIEQRKLEDKIKLGEEQLKCLTDSLPIEQRLAL